MTRPLTCLTLLAAAGAGLYLYQEKHRAQLLDREINRVVHATEQTRDTTARMRAEWAMLNEPDRLAGLAAQHLALQPVTPVQFALLGDLGSRLPAVGAPTQPPPAIEPPLPSPIAAAATPVARPDLAPGAAKPAPPLLAPPLVALPLVAQSAPAAVLPPHPAPPLVAPPLMAQTAPATVLPPRPAAPLMVQATVPPRAPRPVRMTSSKPDAETAAHPTYAPVVPAFASQYPPEPIHRPTVQQAAAGIPPAPYGGPAPGPGAGSNGYASAAPFVGSALGMARTMLAVPVPVANAAELGASAGR